MLRCVITNPPTPGWLRGGGGVGIPVRAGMRTHRATMQHRREERCSTGGESELPASPARTQAGVGRLMLNRCRPAGKLRPSPGPHPAGRSARGVRTRRDKVSPNYCWGRSESERAMGRRGVRTAAARGPHRKRPNYDLARRGCCGHPPRRGRGGGTVAQRRACTARSGRHPSPDVYGSSASAPPRGAAPMEMADGDGFGGISSGRSNGGGGGGSGGGATGRQ
jgi:hypothetical protein